MIMVFEGLMSESVEDAYGLGIITEATHSDEDEAYYCDSILSGEADEEEADYYAEREDNYDPDGWMVAQDRYDRWVYGE